MEELEMICFQLITAAGAAKSHYIEAIQKAKEGNYEEGKELIRQGDEMLKDGHVQHAGLIQKEAAGEGTTMTLLLTHAEDQMMSSEVFKVLAEEMIELYEKVNTLQN